MVTVQNHRVNIQLARHNLIEKRKKTRESKGTKPSHFSLDRGSDMEEDRRKTFSAELKPVCHYAKYRSLLEFRLVRMIRSPSDAVLVNLAFHGAQDPQK
ncbi:hypothetical protein AXG93_773s1320 [Marchantia polymorpha subsp. ruderalis]|uniref:Uncharacterized protein n=1 Tax=Marchantia polymorpha subsp. ruderalis TaxID=1480154 RepID=A0A176WBY0_MARPO|nr:hypothetical protein AXG93_773s1320 [Marchantia polymorpha subsp. ruderalis]